MDILLLKVDKTLAKPAYLQLQEELERLIRAGRLPPGSALPSERCFARSLRLSRVTIRRAIEELVKARHLEQRRGSGKYVLHKEVEQTFDKVLVLVDEADRLGLNAGSVFLEAECIPANTTVARALEIAELETVLRISWLRTADDEPVATKVAHLIPKYQRLSIELLTAKGSLYLALREQFGVAPGTARQVVSARQLSKRESRLLSIKESTPILAIEPSRSMVNGLLSSMFKAPTAAIATACSSK